MPIPKKDYLGTFSGLVRAAFLGEVYPHDGNNYMLKPTLLGKYDVLRSITNPSSELERLVRDLPREFKSVARSELYRKSGGWIESGVQGRKFKEIELGGRLFIIPTLSRISVGIDTSSDSEWTYICIACFEDAECGYAYLEKHLQLPKAKQPSEFKWRELNRAHRTKVVQNLQALMEISCKAALVIKTNALVKPEEKLTDIFIKLVSGSFSGYERLQGDFRTKLRDGFFSLMNDTPIHCDADFSPLSTDKVVRQLVKTLAGGKPFTPLHVGLRSEESQPIQVSDLLCGATKSLVLERTQSEMGLNQIPFDNKLKGRGKDAKVYYWSSRRTTQVPRVVGM